MSTKRKPKAHAELSSNGQAAIAYAGAGLPVFPVHSWNADRGRCSCGNPRCVSPAKHPRTDHGYKDATTNPEKIRAWWQQWPDANIATSPGAIGCMVVDVDPGGDDTTYPETGLYARTPRDGFHLWYHVPPGEHIPNSAGKIAPHVDVRGHDGYVLLPPSATEHGPYEWGEQGKAAGAPRDLVQKVQDGGRRERTKDADVWRIEPDQPKHIELAKEAAAGEGNPKFRLRPAIEGQSGDQDTYDAACMMRSFGLSEETAMDVLWEIYNPRCKPAWEWDDLETKVRNAYRYATSAPGNCTDEYQELKRQDVADLFQPAGAVDPDETAPPMPEGLHTAVSYRDRPPADWLIKGVHATGSYTVASGRSQAGKSFVELAMALSLATGKAWLGQEVEKTSVVVYIAAEGQDRIDADIEAWCKQFGVKRETLADCFFIYDRAARLNTEAGKKALADLLNYVHYAADGRHIQIWFDTLKRNMRGGVSQETETSDVLATVHDLTRNGYGVTLIAHHGRGHGETKGLTEWEDDADFVRHYTGTVRDRSTQVEFAKVKRGQDGWSLAVEYAGHDLGNGVTTLVAAAGKKVEASPSSEHRQEDITPLVDHAVLRFLSENKLREYSDTALADAVACDDELKGKPGASSSSIRQKYLPSLRESRSDCGHCYDRHKRKWRYIEPQGRNVKLFNVVGGGKRQRRATNAA